MHSVGSVIDIKGGKFVVCGYRSYDNEGMVGMGYLLVPYPLGFMSLDSFTLVASDNDYPVVHKGYRDETTESYDRLLEQERAYGRETTMDEALKAFDEVSGELEEMVDEMSEEE